MRDLGFQACCLLCDAGDEPGLKRCVDCIEVHRSVRERMAASDPGDAVFQLAKDLLEYSSNPHRHDHDPIHGPTLMKQQHLAAMLSDEKPVRTGSEIEDIFKMQSEKIEHNPIRDIANQNPWKEVLPDSDIVKKMSESLPDDIEYHSNRTNPSKEISRVDREDRVGEDRDLTDRVAARELSEDFEPGFREVVEVAAVGERKRRRDEWEDVLSDVDEMIDEFDI